METKAKGNGGKRSEREKDQVNANANAKANDIVHKMNYPLFKFFAREKEDNISICAMHGNRLINNLFTVFLYSKLI